MAPNDARKLAARTGRSVVYLDGRGRKRVALAGAKAPLEAWPRQRSPHCYLPEDIARDCARYVADDARHAREGTRENASWERSAARGRAYLARMRVECAAARVDLERRISEIEERRAS